MTIRENVFYIPSEAHNLPYFDASMSTLDNGKVQPSKPQATNETYKQLLWVPRSTYVEKLKTYKHGRQKKKESKKLLLCLQTDAARKKTPTEATSSRHLLCKLSFDLDKLHVERATIIATAFWEIYSETMPYSILRSMTSYRVSRTRCCRKTENNTYKSGHLPVLPTSDREESVLYVHQHMPPHRATTSGPKF